MSIRISNFFIFSILRWEYLFPNLAYDFKDGKIKFAGNIYFYKKRVAYFLLDLQAFHAAATAAKLLQSCPTLCDPIDGSPPGSPVPGILQARTLEWVAISFSDAWKWKVKVKSLSCVRLLGTPWTAAYQAPPSMPLPSPKHFIWIRNSTKWI